MRKRKTSPHNAIIAINAIFERPGTIEEDCCDEDEPVGEEEEVLEEDEIVSVKVVRKVETCPFASVVAIFEVRMEVCMEVELDSMVEEDNEVVVDGGGGEGGFEVEIRDDVDVWGGLFEVEEVKVLVFGAEVVTSEVDLLKKFC